MSRPGERISRRVMFPTDGDTSMTADNEIRHALDLEPLNRDNIKICLVLPLSIPVNKSSSTTDTVSGFLHLPQDHYRPGSDRPSSSSAVAILLSGAGGGVVGPSSMYLSMGDKLASLRRGIPVLRLDYRHPAKIGPCCQDVKSAMSYLRTKYRMSRFVLVGWSFGSAPVCTVASDDPSVIACAVIAGQTAHTDGIRLLNPRPLLLLHGTGDTRLSQRCSQTLYQKYGRRGDRKIHLFEEDNHALTKNSHQAEKMLCKFIARCVGLKFDSDEQLSVIERQLLQDSAKLELMKDGGDLGGEETII